VYLAEQLSQGDRAGHPEGEEGDLQYRWTSLPDVLEEVLSGRITNGLAVAGLLAAATLCGLSSPPPARS
jgi:hypothetical protein